MAVNPRSRRARISGSKPVASAQAPWTRTIVEVSPAICSSPLPWDGCRGSGYARLSLNPCSRFDN